MFVIHILKLPLLYLKQKSKIFIPLYVFQKVYLFHASLYTSTKIVRWALWVAAFNFSCLLNRYRP